jgi:dihydrofolate reductase
MKTILIAAITLDGKIARNPIETVTWTSKKDKSFFKKETQKAGVSILGSNTYKTIAKNPFAKTLHIVMTHHPEKFAAKTKPGTLEFTKSTPKKILKELAARGFKKAVLSGGSEIYAAFLKADLIDEMYLTIIPKTFGKGIPLFKEINIKTKDFKLFNTTKLGKNEILLQYKKSH